MSIAKIIVLEGCDGGGKTTLANYLHDTLGYQIVKTNAPKPGEDVFRSYTDSLMTAIASGLPTVFDRHYMGETIYGPLLRGQDGLGVHGVALLERVIAARGVRLVICAPPWETLEAGWRSKDDLLKKVDQLRHVAATYQKEAARLSLQVYDWTRDQPLTVLDGDDRAPLPDGVTGYLSADTLWVGDQVNPTKLAWDLPFHDLTDSSRYLWDALQAVDWDDRRGAWVNAYDLAGRPHNLAAIAAALPRLRCVVSLGGAAAIACRRFPELDAYARYKLPHPAHWRRFHHYDREGYQELLKEVLDA
jgi:hypothetical protein